MLENERIGAHFLTCIDTWQKGRCETFDANDSKDKSGVRCKWIGPKKSAPDSSDGFRIGRVRGVLQHSNEPDCYGCY